MAKKPLSQEGNFVNKRKIIIEIQLIEIAHYHYNIFSILSHHQLFVYIFRFFAVFRQNTQTQDEKLCTLTNRGVLHTKGEGFIEKEPAKSFADSLHTEPRQPKPAINIKSLCNKYNAQLPRDRLH